MKSKQSGFVAEYTEKQNKEIIKLRAKIGRLEEDLHRCHATSVKYLSELAARRSQVKFLRKIWKATKKVMMCFPDKIPKGQEEVRFDIPAYTIEELRQALNQGADGDNK